MILLKKREDKNFPFGELNAFRYCVENSNDNG